MFGQESIKRVMAEKLEILQKLQSLQKEFRETKDKHSRDTTKLKENLDVVVAREKEVSLGYYRQVYLEWQTDVSTRFETPTKSSKTTMPIC